MKIRPPLTTGGFRQTLPETWQKLPVFHFFWRTVSNKNLTPEKLKELSDFINERY